MSISAEEKNRYLRETAIVLAREGFHTDILSWHTPSFKTKKREPLILYIG